MPNFNLSQQPRFEIVTIDSDIPITAEQILHALNHREGATFCIRSNHGHPNRGGYFFCVQHDLTNNLLRLETIEQEYIDSFSLPDMVRFINHTAGFIFDSEMQLYCQNSLNFRND